MATKPATKKTVKKAPARKVTKKPATRARKSAKQAAKMQSFKLYRNPTPFTTFAVTRQTVYWTILLIVIVAIQLWILKIQIEISELTNILITQQM